MSEAKRPKAEDKRSKSPYPEAEPLLAALAGIEKAHGGLSFRRVKLDVEAKPAEEQKGRAPDEQDEPTVGVVLHSKPIPVDEAKVIEAKLGKAQLAELEAGKPLIFLELFPREMEMPGTEVPYVRLRMAVDLNDTARLDDALHPQRARLYRTKYPSIANAIAGAAGALYGEQGAPQMEFRGAWEAGVYQLKSEEFASHIMAQRYAHQFNQQLSLGGVSPRTEVGATAIPVPPDRYQVVLRGKLINEDVHEYLLLDSTKQSMGQQHREAIDVVQRREAEKRRQEEEQRQLAARQEEEKRQEAKQVATYAHLAGLCVQAAHTMQDYQPQQQVAAAPPRSPDSFFDRLLKPKPKSEQKPVQKFKSTANLLAFVFKNGGLEGQRTPHQHEADSAVAELKRLFEQAGFTEQQIMARVVPPDAAQVAKGVEGANTYKVRLEGLLANDQVVKKLRDMRIGKHQDLTPEERAKSAAMTHHGDAQKEQVEQKGERKVEAKQEFKVPSLLSEYDIPPPRPLIIRNEDANPEAAALERMVAGPMRATALDAIADKIVKHSRILGEDSFLPARITPESAAQLKKDIRAELEQVFPKDAKYDKSHANLLSYAETISLGLVWRQPDDTVALMVASVTEGIVMQLRKQMGLDKVQFGAIGALLSRAVERVVAEEIAALHARAGEDPKYRIPEVGDSVERFYERVAQYSATHLSPERLAQRINDAITYNEVCTRKVPGHHARKLLSKADWQIACQLLKDQNSPRAIEKLGACAEKACKAIAEEITPEKLLTLDNVSTVLSLVPGVPGGGIVGSVLIKAANELGELMLDAADWCEDAQDKLAELFTAVMEDGPERDELAKKLSGLLMRYLESDSDRARAAFAASRAEGGGRVMFGEKALARALPPVLTQEQLAGYVEGIVDREDREVALSMATVRGGSRQSRAEVDKHIEQCLAAVVGDQRAALAMAVPAKPPEPPKRDEKLLRDGKRHEQPEAKQPLPGAQEGKGGPEGKMEQKGKLDADMLARQRQGQYEVITDAISVVRDHGIKLGQPRVLNFREAKEETPPQMFSEAMLLPHEVASIALELQTELDRQGLGLSVETELFMASLEGTSARGEQEAGIEMRRLVIVGAAVEGIDSHLAEERHERQDDYQWIIARLLHQEFAHVKLAVDEGQMRRGSLGEWERWHEEPAMSKQQAEAYVAVFNQQLGEKGVKSYDVQAVAEPVPGAAGKYGVVLRGRQINGDLDLAAVEKREADQIVKAIREAKRLLSGAALPGAAASIEVLAVAGSEVGAQLEAGLKLNFTPGKEEVQVQQDGMVQEAKAGLQAAKVDMTKAEAEKVAANINEKLDAENALGPREAKAVRSSDRDKANKDIWEVVLTRPILVAVKRMKPAAAARAVDYLNAQFHAKDVSGRIVAKAVPSQGEPGMLKVILTGDAVTPALAEKLRPPSPGSSAAQTKSKLFVTPPPRESKNILERAQQVKAELTNLTRLCGLQLHAQRSRDGSYSITSNVVANNETLALYAQESREGRDNPLVRAVEALGGSVKWEYSTARNEAGELLKGEELRITFPSKCDIATIESQLLSVLENAPQPKGPQAPRIEKSPEEQARDLLKAAQALLKQSDDGSPAPDPPAPPRRR